MLLADTEMGWIAAASAAVAAIIAALASFKKSRSADHLAEQKADADLDAQRRKDSLAEWQEIARKLEEQSERRDAVIRQQQEVIQTLADEHADCREEAAEHRTAIHFLYESLKRIYAAAQAAGATDLGPMPVMPPIRERDKERSSRSAFLLRQVAQSQQLLQAADKVLTPPPGKPS